MCLSTRGSVHFSSDISTSRSLWPVTSSSQVPGVRWTLRSRAIKAEMSGTDSDVKQESVGGFAFLSYSRNDSRYVARLAQHMEARGLESWFDRSIESGSDWSLEVETRLKLCTAFVPIVTPASSDSPNCRRELGFAARRDKPILPLLLVGPWTDSASLEIDGLQYEDVTDDAMPGAGWLTSVANRLGTKLQTPSEQESVDAPHLQPGVVPHFRGVLRKGDKGGSVLIWQGQMSARGWILDVDGFFGYVTDLVCRQFQAEKGLVADGIVGGETWRASWEEPIT